MKGLIFMLSDYKNDYLTPQEVADELYVAVSTVYDLLKSGRLHGVKVGRVWRIPIDSLERFVYG